MKNKLLLYFILIPFASFAQMQVDVAIDWLEKSEMSFGDSKINVPQFAGSSYHYEPSERTISFTLNLTETSPINGNAVQITNVVYESLTASQLGDLDPANIQQTPSATLKTNQSRGVKQVFLVLYPIIKDDFGFKRITSFSYSVSSQNAARISQTNKTNVITNSVLSTGDWYQFYVEKSGVYKISKSFLQQLGLNVSAVDPKKIKIYGNGGRMVPLSNSIPYPLDLAENAIQIVGESDGVFNNDDYILFYAEGVDVYNSESQTYNNLYDTKSYYYVTVQGNEGKRIANMVQPTGNSPLNLNTFDDHQFHEEDLVNIARLGRQWYGESFDINQDQEFTFNFPNIDEEEPVKLNATAAAAAFTITSFKVTANEQEVGTISFPSLVLNNPEVFNVSSLPIETSIPASKTIKIKFSYDNNKVPGSKGYLEKISLVAKSKLQGYGKQFQFQNDLSGSSDDIVSYNLSKAAGISQIWDVTDIYNVTKVENPNQDSFSFKAKLGELRKYVAIDPLDFYTPLKTNKTKIANQNIKGTIFKNAQGQNQDIDYVIITPSNLSSQADKLAKFHREDAPIKLNVKVITLESIYQEFSSGKQDVAAIRNCIKYIYDNAANPSKKVKYVNLFGDASYDFKNRTPNNTNIVPIYHALYSNTTGEGSYASDDFFGLMDADEGNINSSFGGIDIAVGRMIHDNAQQADEMVNKVIEYHLVESYGSWRNNYMMISDDSDKKEDASLQNRQNILADKITFEKPFLNVNKILLDSYVQEASAGGSRYPKARTEIFSAFEKGALVVNYLGHGGEDGLTAERIWEKSDGQNLNNRYRYPLFITITCDFSRFDNPTRPTAGEYTYWNPKGGAISMITTIRSILQLSAENFNDDLAEYLFSYATDANPNNSIAENLRMAKNSNPNSSTNVVFYIGDPALMLAIPKPKIKLTSINDKTDFSDPDAIFKSLKKMDIKGTITDESDNPLTNYNGELSTIIFDKFITRSTLNNDGNSPSIPFNILGETIFRGNAMVKDGKFGFSFIVPKDIRIPVANGKISFYSKKNQLFENQTGFDTSIKVGGINEDAAQDTSPPTVNLYMNDENFISGGTTNDSPFLLAHLEDENGINTAGGIGHDMIAILDGDVNNPYILNDYYQTNLDDFTKGTVRFPFRNLAVGLHTITFKAWDVYNNPITAEIQFIVAGTETITLTHVLNYPNPFVNYTEFWFSHNKPYEALDVQVQVMTITGKIVWTKNQLTTPTGGFLSKEISWDGKDDFGNKIGKGVYVYKLTVKSNLTNTKTEKIEKLVIL